MTLQERINWLKRNDIELLQFGDEVEQLDAHLQRLGRRLPNWPPKALVEIGVWQGGSLFLLAHYMAPGATIIGIDPAETDVNHRKAMRVANKLVEQGFDAHVFRKTSRKAKRTVVSWLHRKNRAVDYLHIDGNHSYGGVKDDFTNYAPLVVEGGVIQLHDVTNVHPRTGKDYGTKIFWNEITRYYPDHAVIANTREGRVPGIGVIVVGGDA